MNAAQIVPTAERHASLTAAGLTSHSHAAIVAAANDCDAAEAAYVTIACAAHARFLAEHEAPGYIWHYPEHLDLLADVLSSTHHPVGIDLGARRGSSDLYPIGKWLASARTYRALAKRITREITRLESI